nr:MAG TPA: hypothetical protein [Caudoviricetes sp.]
MGKLQIKSFTKQNEGVSKQNIGIEHIRKRIV